MKELKIEINMTVNEDTDINKIDIIQDDFIDGVLLFRNEADKDLSFKICDAYITKIKQINESENVDINLLKEIKKYLAHMLNERETDLNEEFVMNVYEDVTLTSGYEDEGIYSYDDIVICCHRNIVELINENH